MIKKENTKLIERYKSQRDKLVYILFKHYDYPYYDLKILFKQFDIKISTTQFNEIINKINMEVKINGNQI